MACNLTMGRLVDCKDTIGGLKTIFIAKTYSDNVRTNATFVVNGTDALQIDNAGFANWSGADTNVMTLYRYELRPNLSSMTVNVNSDPAAGTTFFQQTLSVTLQKLDAAMTNELKLITYNRAQVFVMDTNDNIWLMGIDNGCDVTGGTIVTGTAKGDLNGYTLEFASEEKQPLYMVKATAGASSAADYPFDGLGDADAALLINPAY